MINPSMDFGPDEPTVAQEIPQPPPRPQSQAPQAGSIMESVPQPPPDRMFDDEAVDSALGSLFEAPLPRTPAAAPAQRATPAPTRNTPPPTRNTPPPARNTPPPARNTPPAARNTPVPTRPSQPPTRPSQPSQPVQSRTIMGAPARPTPVATRPSQPAMRPTPSPSQLMPTAQPTPVPTRPTPVPRRPVPGGRSTSTGYAVVPGDAPVRNTPTPGQAPSRQSFGYASDDAMDPAPYPYVPPVHSEPSGRAADPYQANAGADSEPYPRSEPYGANSDPYPRTEPFRPTPDPTVPQSYQPKMDGPGFAAGPWNDQRDSVRGMPSPTGAPVGYRTPGEASGLLRAPMPVAPSSRGGLKLVLGVVALVIMLGGGLALGWVFFARDKQPALTPNDPKTTTTPVVTVPVATAPPPDATVAVVTPPQPVVVPPKPAELGKASSATTDIATLEHPILEEITAPVQGQVASITIAKKRDVAGGEPLFSIRYRAGGGSKEALLKRIAELEAKVKEAPGEASVVVGEDGTVNLEDPTVYEQQLARARRELKQMKQVDVATVKATTGGLVESRVKVGDNTTVGSTLGVRLDKRSWTATAIVKDAKPAATWSCVVATPDDSHTGLCKIQSTELIPGDGFGTRVVVEIAATGTTWLKGLDQKPRLILEAPR